MVEESNAYHLRWFTPSSEVKLCGHATLASAHILWSEGYVNDDVPISFRTLSGVLSAEKIGNQIQLDFPAKEEVEVDMEEATVESLIESLGVSATYVGKNEFDYIVEVASPDEIDALSPNFSLLEQIPVRGVIVTAKDTSESIYDFVSRFFAPAVGVNEDPVTGSAHCCLGPYWSKKLRKPDLVAYQASKRGGEVGLKIQGDRVKLLGKAVTVMRSDWLSN